MKEILIQKLGSRKLWVAIIGIIVGLATAFGIDANEYAQIAGIVTSAISVFGYVFAEAKIDAARLENALLENKASEQATETSEEGSVENEEIRN